MASFDSDCRSGDPARSVRGNRCKSLLTTLASIISCLLLAGCGAGDSDVPDAAKHFLDAQAAIATGDNAAALVSLQAAIDADPSTYAYMERIKINGKQGNDAAVEEDVQAILEIDPENRDVAWIRTEMKKPAAARFDASAPPPSARK